MHQHNPHVTIIFTESIRLLLKKQVDSLSLCLKLNLS